MQNKPFRHESTLFKPKSRSLDSDNLETTIHFGRLQNEELARVLSFYTNVNILFEEKITINFEE